MGRVSDTRSRLLCTALRLVWERGYAAVTIEEICDVVGVRKGSFYHFFPTKEAIVTAALEDELERSRGDLDRIFSCTTPPLLRLKNFFQHITTHQLALFRQSGQVLGCPIGSIGCEVVPEEKQLSSCVQSIFKHYEHYLAAAIRDAQAAGEIPRGNVARLARLVASLFEGILAQARVHNDPKLLKSLYPGTLLLLGAPPSKSLVSKKKKSTSPRSAAE